jgi:predicted enzyme related to lactoylglutathione lyase
MGEATTTKFVWYDLMATDPERSRTFFTELFGWTTEDRDMGPMGTYTMLIAGQQAIGGLVPLQDAPDVPPHWIGYVLVDDVDAAGDRATRAGGALCVPGTDIPGVGRFSVITDPDGAVVSPFWSSTPSSGECGAESSRPVPGTVCWHELLTRDPEACRAFYRDVFGWTAEDVDMGDLGPYTSFESGETQVAGMMTMPPDAGSPRGHWLYYFTVENVDDCARRIVELGGRIWHEPSDIPGIGRFAVAADPTGAMFAVWCK